MIKKFICWAWGHKAVAKVYSGKTISVTGICTNEVIPLYRYEKNEFCTRCGKKIED